MWPGQPPQGGVVGLAGPGGINQLGGAHPQPGGNGLGGLGHFFPGGPACRVVGVGVAGVELFGFTKGGQYPGIDRGIGRII